MKREPLVLMILIAGFCSANALICVQCAAALAHKDPNLSGAILAAILAQLAACL
jgi:hypothetical protein